MGQPPLTIANVMPNELNLRQLGVELFSVPWDHHMAILGKAKSAEEFVDWLSEANPNIWEGECSGDPAVYEDFLEFLPKQDYESLSVSQIAKPYFAQLDDYYAPAIMRKVKIIKIPDNAKCIA